MAKHVVLQGECISSIAFDSGLLPETLWNHPENFALKKKRVNPDALLPGDALFVPDITERYENCSTDQRHTFVARGFPARFRLLLVRDDEPRANEAFTLHLDGRQIEGTTDGDGWLQMGIPPNARTVQLVIQSTGEEIHLALGNLDPIDEVSGIQGRLANLGFYEGAIDGQKSDDLAASVGAFQKKNGLPETGEADSATRDALRSAYGH
jgi:N-acetylmuramoyl-L-alanine amidase